MEPKPSRREFGLLAAIGVCVPGIMACGGGICTAESSGGQKRLRVALIGCGGRGEGVLLPYACKEKVVALVDPDQMRLARAVARVKKCDPAADTSKIRLFSDYRVMFDHMKNELDAVIIATPNHHHALLSLMAIRLGIHVYVEKPMALTVTEARQMLVESKKYGVVTQVGQHGHSAEDARRLCEFIWSGAIGQVREVYCWDDRINGYADPRPASVPVPKGLDWDLWLGGAAWRDYYPGLHPHDWHSWLDFGNGSIGNMGNHILDPVFWSLKLKYPDSVELKDVRYGTDGAWPIRDHILWKFPARDGMAPVDVHWYDGIAGDLPFTSEYVGGIGICRKREYQNMPEAVLKLEKQYGINLGRLGSVLIGDKGVIAMGPFGDALRFVPGTLAQSISVPEKTIPRVIGSHQEDFFRACRGGQPACANFDYSGPLAEMVLLGNVAMQTGVGKRIDWNGRRMECLNVPEANRFLSAAPYREGWNPIPK